MGITQPKSGQGLRSGLEKGGFVRCGNRSGTGQRQKSHGHQEMSSLSRAERQNVSLGHPGQVSEQTLTPHWPSMPSRDSSGGRKARSCLSRAHSNRQGSPLHPVSLFTSSLFLYLPVFYLCLPVLNYNLLLHSKALYAPGSTEAKLLHHHRSCPRSARTEMGCNPCDRGGTETSRNNNSNLVSRC